MSFPRDNARSLTDQREISHLPRTSARVPPHQAHPAAGSPQVGQSAITGAAVDGLPLNH